jgi:hypothetical protein
MTEREILLNELSKILELSRECPERGLPVAVELLELLRANEQKDRRSLAMRYATRWIVNS